MKLNDRYWVYSLECVPTGRVYVGLTGKPNPCWRWSQHVVELRNRCSVSKGLQAEWDRYPTLVEWRFAVLAEVNGKRAANKREAECIATIPQVRRLNTTRGAVSLINRRLVVAMLGERRRYVDISREVGLSLGTISKISRQLRA